METRQNTTDIDSSFDSYEKIQILHLNIMKSGNMPDLDLMTRERNHTFENLKTAIDTFISTAGTLYGTDSISVLSRYEKRLALIMKLDDEIAVEIKKHRSTLKDSLNRMKKGKIAMNGYKMAGTNASTPYVLSMNK